MRSIDIQARARLKQWGVPDKLIPYLDLSELDIESVETNAEKDTALKKLMGKQVLSLIARMETLQLQDQLAALQSGGNCGGSTIAGQILGNGEAINLEEIHRSSDLAAFTRVAAVSPSSILPFALPAWLWELLKAIVAALVGRFGWEGFRLWMETGSPIPGGGTQPVEPGDSGLPAGPDPTGSTGGSPAGPDPTGSTGGSPAGPDPTGSTGGATTGSNTMRSTGTTTPSRLRWYDAQSSGSMKKCTAVNVVQLPAGFKTCIKISDNGEWNMLWDAPGEIEILVDKGDGAGPQTYVTGFGALCYELVGPGVFTAHLKDGEEWCDFKAGIDCPCD